MVASSYTILYKVTETLRQLDVPYEYKLLGSIHPNAPYEIKDKQMIYLPTLGWFFTANCSLDKEAYPAFEIKYWTDDDWEKEFEQVRILNKWAARNVVHIMNFDARETDLIPELVEIHLRYASTDDMGEWLCNLANLRGLELKPLEE